LAPNAVYCQSVSMSPTVGYPGITCWASVVPENTQVPNKLRDKLRQPWSHCVYYIYYILFYYYLKCAICTPKNSLPVNLLAFILYFIFCLILFLFYVVQGSLSEQGELLRKDVFSVWEYKKEHHRSIRDLRFQSHTRHVFLYERLIIFSKRKDDSTSNSDKSATYTLKNSLPVSLFTFILYLFILFQCILVYFYFNSATYMP